MLSGRWGERDCYLKWARIYSGASVEFGLFLLYNSKFSGSWDGKINLRMAKPAELSWASQVSSKNEPTRQFYPKACLILPMEEHEEPPTDMQWHRFRQELMNPGGRKTLMRTDRLGRRCEGIKGFGHLPSLDLSAPRLPTQHLYMRLFCWEQDDRTVTPSSKALCHPVRANRLCGARGISWSRLLTVTKLPGCDQEFSLCYKHLWVWIHVNSGFLIWAIHDWVCVGSMFYFIYPIAKEVICWPFGYPPNENLKLPIVYRSSLHKLNISPWILSGDYFANIVSHAVVVFKLWWLGLLTLIQFISNVFMVSLFLCVYLYMCDTED